MLPRHFIPSLLIGKGDFSAHLHPQHTEISLFKWKEINLVKMAFLRLCGT